MFTEEHVSTIFRVERIHPYGDVIKISNKIPVLFPIWKFDAIGGGCWFIQFPMCTLRDSPDGW
jgi:hypothetical protein